MIFQLLKDLYKMQALQRYLDAHPELNIDVKLQNYLDRHPRLSTDVIGHLLATGIVRHHNIIISMVNLYIREHKMIISEESLYYHIYMAECHYASDMARGHSMLTFADYDEHQKNHICDRYRHLLKYD